MSAAASPQAGTTGQKLVPLVLQIQVLDGKACGEEGAVSAQHFQLGAGKVAGCWQESGPLRWSGFRMAFPVQRGACLMLVVYAEASLD